jgi:hypothetical protein
VRASFSCRERRGSKREETEIRKQKAESKKQSEDGIAFNRDRGILEKKNGAGERS